MCKILTDAFYAANGFNKTRIGQEHPQNKLIITTTAGGTKQMIAGEYNGEEFIVKLPFLMRSVRELKQILCVVGLEDFANSLK